MGECLKAYNLLLHHRITAHCYRLFTSVYYSEQLHSDAEKKRIIAHQTLPLLCTLVMVLYNANICGLQILQRVIS
jgi:hypothetical protein